MYDLREHATLIRSLVAEENTKDPNWKWSVKSISKMTVRIRWGYLDYLQEKDNCFVLTIEEDDMMFARQKLTGTISAEIVSENPTKHWEVSVESAIHKLIEDIAHCAHSRY